MGTFEASGNGSYGQQTLSRLAPLLQVDFFGADSVTSTTTHLPLSARALLFRCLDRFIQAALPDEDEGWYYASSFERTQDARQFQRSCDLQDAPWREPSDPSLNACSSSVLPSSESLFQDPSASMSAVSSILEELLPTSGQSSSARFTPFRLFQRLSQQLLNAFVEVSQNCFMPGATSIPTFQSSLEIVHHAFNTLCRLYRASISDIQSASKVTDKAAELLLQFLQRSAPYFPFETLDHLQHATRNVSHTSLIPAHNSKLCRFKILCAASAPVSQKWSHYLHTLFRVLICSRRILPRAGLSCFRRARRFSSLWFSTSKTSWMTRSAEYLVWMKLVLTARLSVFVEHILGSASANSMASVGRSVSRRRRTRNHHQFVAPKGMQTPKKSIC